MWMIGRDIRKLVDNGDRERLLWLSRNEDAHIRAEAALALGELGGPGSVQPLIRLLEESTEDNEVRSCAAFALGKIGERMSEKKPPGPSNNWATSLERTR
jgi:HEAT repeat protein